MKNHEVLLAIYDAWKLAQETPLQCFLRLEKLPEDRLTGLSRTKFEELWKQCETYTAKFKLDAITMRQQALKDDICGAMLACDPPWEQVAEFCRLIKEAQESPRGLPYALEALAEYKADVAAGFRERCTAEFPDCFKSVTPEE
jgi:hypothetical protein